MYRHKPLMSGAYQCNRNYCTSLGLGKIVTHFIFDELRNRLKARDHSETKSEVDKSFRDI